VDRDDAKTIMRRLEQRVREGMARRRSENPGTAGKGAPRPVMSKPAYLAAVARIKGYIAAGDVYQVNLTQRFDAALLRDPFCVYERLRRRSPAPFSCYLNLGSFQIVGSSPERFLRIANGRAETRPIKGTRPRGRDPIEDERLRDELFRSEKDRAELLMIVDLERNDLGRVCEFGTVAVDDLCRLETHPTVHHLAATVSGRLRPECDALECIRAMFPGGSITGAPKIRAMQIIDEVETCRRGIYTGSVGYIGFDGSADLNIAIRTIICSRGRATYHVGGGIVWDSDPEAEFKECMDKGRAMFESLADSLPC
jgi:para-aminobenzoate synthetase component 1